ncbi:MAG: segregation/condensation protein A [Parachlamydiaceae bacterium]|nr:segregation/condensation protein A [Parachlamydiaceae bacterium]
MNSTSVINYSNCKTKWILPTKTMLLKQTNYTLPNFEGTLDFLLCLIQKEEIDIYDISIQEILKQFLIQMIEDEKGHLDQGAEFISTASYLVWLKSKMLLADEPTPLMHEPELEDPHFEIIHHLIDYCRFKQIGKELSSLQEKEQTIYYRGYESPEWKKPLGIDHISLEDLTLLFNEMLSKAPQQPDAIKEEIWSVSDKVHFLKKKLENHHSISFVVLFNLNLSRIELIVTFLALLELMKMGEVVIRRESTTQEVLILSNYERNPS